MKKFDPQEGITYVPYPRAVVEVIDILIEFKRKMGVPDYIDNSDAAWKVVDKTFELWATVYPHEYKQFFADQKEKWANLINDYGASIKEKGDGGAQIRAHITLPMRLHQMLQVLFPNNRWTKDFYIKLARKQPLLRNYKKL